VACTLHSLRGGDPLHACAVRTPSARAVLACGHPYHTECLLDYQHIAYPRAVAQGQVVCPACRHAEPARAEWTVADDHTQDVSSSSSPRPSSVASTSTSIYTDADADAVMVSCDDRSGGVQSLPAPRWVCDDDGDAAEECLEVDAHGHLVARRSAVVSDDAHKPAAWSWDPKKC